MSKLDSHGAGTKAVILAAGLGNRISEVSRDVPKPLLPIDKPFYKGEKAGSNGTHTDKGATTFLDWHLFALAKVGVTEIYIVGNNVTHGTHLRAMDTVKAQWILNPTEDLTTSGSGHSTWYAFHSDHNILDGRSRVILMDADIVYDVSLMDRLVASSGDGSKTLVCGDYHHTHEEVLVFAEPENLDMPRLHGKGLLDTPLATGLQCIGEATGILLFEPGDHDALKQTTDWCMRFSTAKTRSEHEDITQRMMSQGRMRAVRFSERDHLFMEVDTPEEYRRLLSDVAPRLQDSV